MAPLQIHSVSQNHPDDKTRSGEEQTQANITSKHKCKGIHENHSVVAACEGVIIP